VAEWRRRVTLPFFAALSFLFRVDDLPTAIGTMSGTSTGSAPQPPPACFGCLYT
jgi:hypothetical protein